MGEETGVDINSMRVAAIHGSYDMLTSFMGYDGAFVLHGIDTGMASWR